MFYIYCVSVFGSDHFSGTELNKLVPTRTAIIVSIVVMEMKNVECIHVDRNSKISN